MILLQLKRRESVRDAVRRRIGVASEADKRAAVAQVEQIIARHAVEKRLRDR